MVKEHDTVEYISEDNGKDDKIKKVKKQLKACHNERAEYLAGWQRAKADLINYKKEQEEKNSDIFKFANENLIIEILLVLDSFELALKHSDPKSPEAIGLSQIYNQLKSILKNNGFEEIKSVGEKFSPEFHESVGEIKKGKPGIVVQEIQKGYKLNEKVIRPAKVKISK